MTWITAKFPDLPKATRDNLVAGTTTREGGISKAPYEGLNIATHVADSNQSVLTNRAILRDSLSLPSEPYWLNQTHSSQAIEIPYEYRHSPSTKQDTSIEADAAYTRLKEHVCAVMTADCLPVLMVDEHGTQVAAIHAGWRGLANGIISKTIAQLDADAAALHVWLGPAIGPASFEVGDDVQQAFVHVNANNASAFTAVNHSQGKFMCDIYQLAKNELTDLGVRYISGGEYCTYSDAEKFYSYRRDGQTGRMVSLIWLNK